MKNLIINRVLAAPRIFQLKNIDPKKLGFVLKDGSVNFINQETAIDYGINQCRKSLTQKKPFERAIGIKGSRIVFEINGDNRGIPLHNASEIIIHSHPDTYAHGCTTALSAEDYNSFIERACLKELYAVNSKGEHYKMSRIPGFDYSKIDTSSTFGEFNVCMNRTLFAHKSVPAEQRDLFEKCVATKDENAFYLEFYDKYITPCMSGMEKLCKTLVDKTHEFWVKFGEKFGVKTETNFSNFTNT